MGSPTFTTEVVVLKKTKLGESDLIVTCLTPSGSQVQFVAKGARKPSSTFASRLELFSHASLLAVEGRSSLHIVKEVRLIEGHPALRSSFERSAGAQVVCEFLCKASQPGLDVERLFPMTLAVLKEMGACGEDCVGSLVAAFLVKGFVFCGFRPELGRCVCCGKEGAEVRSAQGGSWFSFIEGGTVCSGCHHGVECVSMEGATIDWLTFYMHTAFSDIVAVDSHRASFGCLQVCQQWCRTHLGSSLRSLDFLLANPMQ